MTSKKSQRKVARKAVVISTSNAGKKFGKGRKPQPHQTKTIHTVLTNRTKDVKDTKKSMRQAGVNIQPGTTIHGVNTGNPGTHKAPHPKKSKPPRPPKTPKAIGDKKRLTTKPPSASKARVGRGRLGGTVTTRKDRGKK